MLRDFWFPALLALAGIIPGILANYTTGNARRVMLTLTVICLFVAIESYIWGDPVRGPFAYLTQSSKNSETFEFVAGVTCGYPVAQLKNGVDFSQCLSMTGQPIELWVQKTWWSGLRVRLKLKGPGGVPILLFENQKLQLFGSDFDVNYDDYAFEVVGPTRSPEFQLVVSKDYDRIYINARINQGNGMLILKERRMHGMSFQEANKPENHLDRLFRYPSSIHQGERD